MELNEAVTVLTDNIDNLNPKDKAFALDLLRKAQKYGASAGQAKWIKIMSERATGKVEPQPEAIEIGDLSKLVIMLTGTKLKWPKIRLVMDSGSKLVLSIAGMKARFPGTVNLTDGSKYGDPNGVFYGRIMQDGKFQPNARAMDHVEEVALFLMNFCMDPHAVAHAHGQKTGNCCFCAKDLTDKRSVAAGYGPVCAEHYGLSGQWAAAADQDDDGALPEIDLEGDEAWADQEVGA